MRGLLKLFSGDEGQGLTEYGLILAVFVVVVISALILLGPQITGLFTEFNSKVS